MLFMESISLNSSVADATGSNHIYIINENGKREEVSSIEGLEIISSGKNNVIELYAPVGRFIQSRILCGEANHIKIGSSRYNISNLDINICFSGCKLTIGSNFSCRGALIYMQEPYTEICIGDDCMFAEQIFITISDMHTIFDNETKEVINNPQNIYIGSHVWLGFRTAVLKGARISDFSVAGTGSVITKSFSESNVILAGNPAKIIRHNINWSRKPVFKYKEQKEAEEKVLRWKNVLKETLEKLQNEKVILWGASLFLKEILSKMEISPSIIGIVDKAPEKWNTGFCGYRIYPPENLNILKPDKVLLTIYNNNEKIYKSLKQEFSQKYPNIELTNCNNEPLANNLTDSIEGRV